MGKTTVQKWKKATSGWRASLQNVLSSLFSGREKRLGTRQVKSDEATLERSALSLWVWRAPPGRGILRDVLACDQKFTKWIADLRLT